MRKSIVVDDETVSLRESTNKNKKTGLKRKKKPKDITIPKNVDFRVDPDIMPDAESKSNRGSICLVLDPVEDTISVYSGKHSIIIFLVICLLLITTTS